MGSGGSGVSKRQRASMVWFKQRLLEQGFVTTGQQRDSLNFILGPLHVQGTATMIKPRALVNNRDRMTPGKDRAFALDHSGTPSARQFAGSGADEFGVVHTDGGVAVPGRHEQVSSGHQTQGRERRMTNVTQRIVLGAAMNKPEWAREVWERLTPEQHFRGPDLDAATAGYVAWQKEHSNDPQVVLLTLQALGLHRRYSGSNLLTMYEQSFPASDSALRMAIGQLEEDRQRDQVLRISERLAGMATNTDSDLAVDVSAVAAELAVSVQTRVHDPLAGTLTLQQLMDMDFPNHGEVIPGTTENKFTDRADRP